MRHFTALMVGAALLAVGPAAAQTAGDTGSMQSGDRTTDGSAASTSETMRSQGATQRPMTRGSRAAMDRREKQITADLNRQQAQRAADQMQNRMAPGGYGSSPGMQGGMSQGGQMQGGAMQGGQMQGGQMQGGQMPGGQMQGGTTGDMTTPGSPGTAGSTRPQDDRGTQGTMGSSTGGTWGGSTSGGMGTSGGSTTGGGMTTSGGSTTGGGTTTSGGTPNR